MNTKLYNSREITNNNQNNKYNQYNNKYNNLYTNQSNNKTQFKPKSYNGIFIAILSVLYILFINKIAEMLSASNVDDGEKISSYVMIVYFISIMGLVVGYVWMIEQNNGNYVLRKSLTYGGVTMLLYAITNYWEYLDDYAKLIMLALSISCVVYYAY
jgi:hypothetical protein